MNLLFIPLFPLISFVILILVGRRLGKAASLVSLAALLGSMVLSIRLFLTQGAHHAHPLHQTALWLPLERPLALGFLADPLSITMCLVVTVVGWLIMLYATGYMSQDPRYSRFFAYLSLFCAAMLTLVLADHFILLYIGWEVVGLCSYFLISFWFEKPAAANAGKKAFLTTRVGDLGLLAAILLLYRLTGNLSFIDLEARTQLLGPWSAVVALLIFWGAMGKSAQFPLHVWLPDAMEGPTPVSALIHAATMVAAGVYLVARTLPLFLADPTALLVVAAIGGITSFFAATVACVQTDLKKVLAYSTISQLGLMMMALGFGSAFAGMFHLVTHAWFKALLFLGAGSVIHAVHHQEMTKMGGLLKVMPITGVTFILGAVAMAGIPPLSGFWSKEEILIAASAVWYPPVPFLSVFFVVLVLVISGLTAFYITRAVVLTFFGAPREKSHPHESPRVMTGPLTLLALGAVGVGILGSPWSGHAFQHFLGSDPPGSDPTGSDPIILVASIAVAAGGILLSLLRYGAGVVFLPEGGRALLRPVYRLIQNRYYIDELYDRLFVQPAFRLSHLSFRFDQKVVDGAVNTTGAVWLWISRVKGWVDQVFVDGAVNLVGLVAAQTGSVLRLLQTGLVQNYLLIAFGVTVGIFLLLRGIIG